MDEEPMVRRSTTLAEASRDWQFDGSQIVQFVIPTFPVGELWIIHENPRIKHYFWEKPENKRHLFDSQQDWLLYTDIRLQITETLSCFGPHTSWLRVGVHPTYLGDFLQELELISYQMVVLTYKEPSHKPPRIPRHPKLEVSKSPPSNSDLSKPACKWLKIAKN